MFGFRLRLSESFLFWVGCGSGLVGFGSVLALTLALLRLWLVSSSILALRSTSGFRFRRLALGSNIQFSAPAFCFISILVWLWL